MHKKIAFLLVLFSLLLLTTNSSYAQRSCGTHIHLEKMLKDPVFAKKYNKERADVLISAQQRAFMPCSTPLIIPLAVHYESGSISNQCMIDAAIAQIDQVNLDFKSCNANIDDLCTWINAGCTNFGGTAGADAMPVDGSCIQFCLADQNLPAGEDNIGGYAITSGDYDSNSQNASNAWQGYINIYVGAAGGALGFVPFLGGAGNANNTSGASVLTSTFGATGFAGCEGVGTNGTFSGGATLTHELGHWFGLEHTFSDNVADTPPQTNSNFGCPTVDLNACTSSVGNDYSGNFMDYVDDDCMFTFTQDQVDIMISTADVQGDWNTNSISCYTDWQNGTNTYASCASGPCGSVNPPVTAFTPNSGSINVCAGEQIILTDQSTDNPTSWDWIIGGTSNPSITSSTSQNPSFTVANSGTLTLQLIASNSNGAGPTVNGTVNVVVLAASDPLCQVTPCLDYAGGPYTNFNYADACFVGGCPSISGAFEVWENEAYFLAGLRGGTSYTFEHCTNYDATTWSSVLTVGVYDGAGGAVPSSQFAVIQGCSLTFTAPNDGDYIITITGDGTCGGAENQTDNGVPTFQCNAATACSPVCGDSFTDVGNTAFSYPNNSNRTYTICPDNPTCDFAVLTFNSFDVEADAACQYDVLTVYDGNGTSGTNLGGYCGTTIPGPFTSTDVSTGCLTVVFTSDNTVIGAGWEADVTCIPNGTCGVCPNDYDGVNTLSGIETGTGGVGANGDYETDGIITSTQDITSGVVDYDSAIEINLNAGFCVQLGAEFNAFIDGCNGTGGTINPLSDNDTDEAKMNDKTWIIKTKNAKTTVEFLNNQNKK